MPQKQEEEHKLHKKRVRTEGLGSASMPITIDAEEPNIKEEPKESKEQKKLTKEQKVTRSIHNLLGNPYSNRRSSSSSTFRSHSSIRESSEHKERHDRKR